MLEKYTPQMNEAMRESEQAFGEWLRSIDEAHEKEQRWLKNL